VPMIMIGMLVDQIVHMGIEVFAIHPFVMGSRDHLPEVADDSVDEESVTDIIPIHAPGIGCALAHNFEHPPRRMVPPNAAVELLTFAGARAGLAHVGGALDSMPA